MTMTRTNAMNSLRRISAVLALTILAIAFAIVPSATSAPDDVEQRVESILSRMTIEDKIDILSGVDDFYIRAYPQLGIPRLRMADGPLGVRHGGPSTANAGGILLAASWDPELAVQEGTEIGRDARAKGVHFMLGPAMNIYRAPMNGRNFEYLGEDPYLAGKIAVGYIKGMQAQGVSATAKHFMGNNSEFDRHNTDSIIDERTMREIYLPAFEACVKEGHVGAVMDSYNLTNGTHMTQNAHLNIEILKKEWGFTGILMSDWTSTYDAVGVANGGMDLEMPKGVFLNRETLLPAINQGQVTVATIDDKVRRILRVAIQFGWLDRNQTDLSIPRYNREGDQVALRAAQEGIVLLKNDNNLLPLNKGAIKSVLVVGPDAYPAVPVGGGSARVVPFEAVSVLQGLSDYLGNSAKVFYNPGLATLSEMAEATTFTTAATGGTAGLKAEHFAGEDLQGAPIQTGTEPYIDFAPPSKKVLPDQALSSRWTGNYSPISAGKFDFFVSSTGEDGGNYRLYVDDRLILDDWTTSRELLGVATLTLDATAHKVVVEHHGHSNWLGGHFRVGIVREGTYVLADAKAMAATADAVVVAAGFDPESESEGADRTFRLPPGQDELIEEMTGANKNTIVLISAGGSVDTNEWIDRVPALVQAWYPGQEGGKAIAEILFGEVNPSGKLPITFERRWEDNPVHDTYYPQAGTNRVIYKEGVFVGYRGYEKNNTKPLFPFGYGLSYTTFKYANLSVKPAEGKAMFQITFDITNTGAMEGSDISEVYVADPHSKIPRPAKELKGFARTTLKPGETKTATVTLDKRSFAYYDEETKQWRADSGEYEILVARSSQDIQLRGKIMLPQ